MSEASRESNGVDEGDAGSGEPPTFEQAIEQLESIIEGIESGEVGLETSLQQYERGMKLIRHCRGVLERAEQRIEQLTVDDAGELRGPEDAEGGAESDAAESGGGAETGPTD